MKKLIILCCILLIVPSAYAVAQEKISIELSDTKETEKVIIEKKNNIFINDELTNDEIIKMAEEEDVVRIHPNQVFYLFDDYAEYFILEDNATIKKKVYADEDFIIYAGYGMDVSMRFHKQTPSSAKVGEGISICVLDTGIYKEHSYFINNTIIQSNFINETDEDIYGHGTHIAGIIAKIVPSATLYIGKVCYSNGICFESDVLEGMEWCNENNVDLISMSFGRTHYEGDCDNYPTSILVNQYADNGILSSMAAGNKVLFEEAKVAVPSCAEKGISVSAVQLILFNYFDGSSIVFSPANYDVSNAVIINGVPFDYGAHLIDMSANGDVNSAWIDGNTRFLMGTSMATPHVTGALAQLLYLSDGDPEIIRQTLYDGATKGHSGNGLLDNAKSCEILYDEEDSYECGGYFVNMPYFFSKGRRGYWVKANIDGKDRVFEFYSTLRSETGYSNRYKKWDEQSIGGNIKLLKKDNRYEIHIVNTLHPGNGVVEYYFSIFREKNTQASGGRFVALENCDELYNGKCKSVIAEAGKPVEVLYPIIFKEKPRLNATITFTVKDGDEFNSLIKRLSRYIGRYIKDAVWNLENS